MTFREWIAQPFVWISQAFCCCLGEGGKVVTMLERPIVIAGFIAIMAGFVGGIASRTPLPRWPWPWVWPSPPAPTSPLAKALQAAYRDDTDSDKGRSLAYLQAVYAGMADAVPAWTDVKTNADALANIKRVVESPAGLTAGQVVHLRKAIAAAFAQKFGTTGASPINMSDLATELAAVAIALKEID